MPCFDRSHWLNEESRLMKMMESNSLPVRCRYTNLLNWWDNDFQWAVIRHMGSLRCQKQRGWFCTDLVSSSETFTLCNTHTCSLISFLSVLRNLRTLLVVQIDEETNQSPVNSTNQFMQSGSHQLDWWKHYNRIWCCSVECNLSLTYWHSLC